MTVIKIKLDPFERELILKYGYPFSELQSQLKRLSTFKQPAIITFSGLDIDMVTGDLSRSINHGQVPNALVDSVDDLCSRLELHL